MGAFATKKMVLHSIFAVLICKEVFILSVHDGIPTYIAFLGGTTKITLITANILGCIEARVLVLFIVSQRE